MPESPGKYLAADAVIFAIVLRHFF